MPSRRKSIFHLGDDDDGGEATETTSTASSCCLVNEVKCVKRATEGAVEGLRILIHHRDHAGAARVVSKATMKARKQPHVHHHHLCLLPRVFPAMDFLKRCCFCTRELNPCKDVYMYRGDQGFCSKECRNRQILMDERREFEMAMRNRLKTAAAAAAHQQHGRLRNEFHVSDRNRRIPAVLA